MNGNESRADGGRADPGQGDGNWGRWGADDETGALNLVGPDAILAGAALVTEGRTISLAQPLGPASPMPPHRSAPRRFMDRDGGDYAAGARAPGGFKFAEDTVVLSTHSGTHLDALSHTWSGDTLYNGHPAASLRSTRGAQRCGADKLRPVATRGVLLDLVEGYGGPLPPGTPVGPSDLEAAYARAGVTPMPGDALLLRTGWWEVQADEPAYYETEPGPTPEAARWLAELDVALVGADNYAVEVQPAGTPSMFPVHLELLHRNGIPLLENLSLLELARTGRATFQLVVAPLPLAGSTASPVTPLAVL